MQHSVKLSFNHLSSIVILLFSFISFHYLCLDYQLQTPNSHLFFSFSFSIKLCYFGQLKMIILLLFSILLIYSSEDKIIISSFYSVYAQCIRRVYMYTMYICLFTSLCIQWMSQQCYMYLINMRSRLCTFALLFQALYSFHQVNSVASAQSLTVYLYSLYFYQRQTVSLSTLMLALFSAVISQQHYLSSSE